MEPILSVEALSIDYRTSAGTLRAVDAASLAVSPGQTLVILGESGSGKSSLLRGVLRLHNPSSTRLQGRVMFRGQDLLGLPESQMAGLRGASIAMIFQDPASALDPYYRVGDQIVEVIRVHQRLGKAEAYQIALRMLAEVGIAAPEAKAKAFPYELSGGMKQRVMIAMAIACKPDVLLADEPTSSLDVTTQAQILDLLAEIRERLHMAVVLVTHDLGVAAAVADQVAVMYAGEVVEAGTRDQVLGQPQHPYTQGLIKANVTESTFGLLNTIPGEVPNLLRPPSGCRFAARCATAQASCVEGPPPVVQLAGDHSVRCINAVATAVAAWDRVPVTADLAS